MREILFRAKRVDNGEWVEGYPVKYPSGKVEIFKECGEPPDILLQCEVDPETLCQCTGMKDTNGKRIWENDIVLCETGESAFGYREYRKTIFVDDITNHETTGILQEYEDAKVLGNRFDNPGLLGQDGD